MTINFYSTKGPYGCFSNFSNHPVKISGKEWPTTEHYFQAQKFAGTPHEDYIRLSATPGAAAQKGRSRKLPLRPDWEQVKDDVMRRAIRAKVDQHEDVYDALIATENAILVEHTERDSYWGDGGDGSGNNMLGKILMEVRNECLSR